MLRDERVEKKNSIEKINFAFNFLSKSILNKIKFSNHLFVGLKKESNQKHKKIEKNGKNS